MFTSYGINLPETSASAVLLYTTILAGPHPVVAITATAAAITATAAAITATGTHAVP
jgi:hypothetical protein